MTTNDNQIKPPTAPTSSFVLNLCATSPTCTPSEQRAEHTEMVLSAELRGRMATVIRRAAGNVTLLGIDKEPYASIAFVLCCEASDGHHERFAYALDIGTAVAEAAVYLNRSPLHLANLRERAERAQTLRDLHDIAAECFAIYESYLGLRSAASRALNVEVFGASKGGDL